MSYSQPMTRGATFSDMDDTIHGRGLNLGQQLALDLALHETKHVCEPASNKHILTAKHHQHQAPTTPGTEGQASKPSTRIVSIQYTGKRGLKVCAAHSSNTHTKHGGYIGEARRKEARQGVAWR
jgi:hypothetical protein